MPPGVAPAPLGDAMACDVDELEVDAEDVDAGRTLWRAQGVGNAAGERRRRNRACIPGQTQLFPTMVRFHWLLSRFFGDAGASDGGCGLCERRETLLHSRRRRSRVDWASLWCPMRWSRRLCTAQVLQVRGAVVSVCSCSVLGVMATLCVFPMPL